MAARADKKPGGLQPAAHERSPTGPARGRAVPSRRGARGGSRTLGWPPAAWGLLLLVAAAIAHWPALYGGFIWDDETYIVTNRYVVGDGGVSAIWMSYAQPDYWPLTMTTHWLEWRLWEKQTEYYRIVNILLHGMNAVLIWLIGRKLAIPGVWVAALLFAVHPLSVESVDWIFQRKTLLSTALAFGSIWCALTGHELRRAAPYALAIGLFVLAMLAKTAVVMLPVSILICLWWRRRRIGVAELVFVAPFMAISLVLGLVGMWFQLEQSIGTDIVRNDNFWSRLAVAGWATWFYIGKILFPVGLSFVYPRWQIDASSPWSYLPTLAIGLLAGLFLWKRQTWGAAPLTALGYYFVNLFPALGFVNIYFMRYSLVADHWQYLAMPGVLVLVAGVGAWLVERRPAYRKPALAAVGIISALLVVGTRSRAAIFGAADNELLWHDTIRKNPGSYMAYNNLGTILGRKHRWDDAAANYRKAVELAPFEVTNRCNLGRALYATGQVQAAEDQFREALTIDPAAPEVLRNLASLASEQGRAEEAIGYYERSLRGDPDNAEAQSGLGLLLYRQGKLDAAQAHLQTALRRDPRATIAHYNLGLVYFRQQKPTAAAAEFRAAIALNPKYLEAYLMLGSACEALGQGSEAIAVYRTAASLGPNAALVHFRLGSALATSGQLEEAAAELRRCLKLKPNDPQAQAKLAEVDAKIKASR